LERGHESTATPTDAPQTANTAIRVAKGPLRPDTSRAAGTQEIVMTCPESVMVALPEKLIFVRGV